MCLSNINWWRKWYLWMFWRSAILLFHYYWRTNILTERAFYDTSCEMGGRLVLLTTPHMSGVRASAQSTLVCINIKSVHILMFTNMLQHPFRKPKISHFRLWTWILFTPLSPISIIWLIFGYIQLYFVTTIWVCSIRLHSSFCGFYLGALGALVLDHILAATKQL